MSSNNLAVSARGLGRRFGRHWALSHLDLEVGSGEVLLVAGPNGSGKTTLLRILAGLSRPTIGSLRLFGRDPVTERLAVRRSVAMVTHKNYLYEGLTALEMLRVWARLLGLPTEDGPLVELLAEVSLADHRNHRIRGYSAGMRKRLTLLRVRLEEPRLVLLDEPFAALDPPGQRLVRDWIEDFAARKIAVVMASHALSQASTLCHRALLMQRGQCAWQGPPERVLERLEETA